jgi:hypothetical protein
LKRDSLGGALDLDLLSPFPQKDATNSGRIKRRIELFKVNNGGERIDEKNYLDKRWEKGIYRGLQNIVVGDRKTARKASDRYYRLSKRCYSLRIKEKQKTSANSSCAGTTAFWDCSTTPVKTCSKTSEKTS